MKFLRDPIEGKDEDNPTKHATGCIFVLAFLAFGWQVWEMVHGRGIDFLFR